MQLEVFEEACWLVVTTNCKNVAEKDPKCNDDGITLITANLLEWPLITLIVPNQTLILPPALFNLI